MPSPPPAGTNALGNTPPPIAQPTPGVPTAAPPPGSQTLAINVNGPTAIDPDGLRRTGFERLLAGAGGGTTCQLSLTLPAGTYSGTIGNAAIAFSVAPATTNVVNLTLGGVPAQLAVVPGSSMSAQNAQGGHRFLRRR